jgi:hypothetical protein
MRWATTLVLCGISSSALATSTYYTKGQQQAFRKQGQDAAEALVTGARALATGLAAATQDRPVSGGMQVARGAASIARGGATTAVTVGQEVMAAGLGAAQGRRRMPSAESDPGISRLPPALQRAHDRIQQRIWEEANDGAQAAVGARPGRAPDLARGAKRVATSVIQGGVAGAVDALRTFAAARSGRFGK